MSFCHIGGFFTLNSYINCICMVVITKLNLLQMCRSHFGRTNFFPFYSDRKTNNLHNDYFTLNSVNIGLAPNTSKKLSTNFIFYNGY